jgi:hypothetical protein
MCAVLVYPESFIFVDKFDTLIKIPYICGSSKYTTGVSCTHTYISVNGYALFTVSNMLCA